MKKAMVTYTAPKDGSKVLELAGTTLLSGEAKQVVCDDHLMTKLEAASKGGSTLLKVDGVADYTPPPPKAEPPPKAADHHEKHK